MAVELQVCVAYALPDRQWLIDVRLPEGATVAAAIAAARLHEHVADFDLAALNVGIFGKACSLDTLLRDGDRVELYRLLLIDPKDARRQRATRR